VQGGSNTAADHVAVFDATPSQLLASLRARDKHGKIVETVRG
jgi:hypothetical protein